MSSAEKDTLSMRAAQAHPTPHTLTLPIPIFSLYFLRGAYPLPTYERAYTFILLSGPLYSLDYKLRESRELSLFGSQVPRPELGT